MVKHPHSPAMRHLRFILLLSLVLGCAALTVWVVSLAAAAGRLDQTLLFSLAPLAMIGALAFKALRDGKK